MVHKVLLFVLVLWNCSCTRLHEGGLEKALLAAGDNRGELQAALDYFSRSAEDSLKLRACAFLIAHMPGHYGYEGEGLDAFRLELDSLYPGSPYLRQALQSVYFRTSELGNMVRRVDDIQEINADFLVKHIERCFAMRERLPWLKETTFEEFCDYVLPYRCEHERLEDVAALQDTSLFCKEAFRLAMRLEDMNDLPCAVARFCAPDGYPASAWLPSPFRYHYRLSCYEMALVQFYAWRAMGVPCAMELIPAWGDVNGSHTYATVIDSYFRDGFPEEFRYHKIPKVYRMMYRRMGEMPEERLPVPEFFQSPFLLDVTDRYVHTADVEVDVPEEYDDGRSVYLCVFNTGDWTAVARAVPQGGKARFEKMGHGVVYLPMCHDSLWMRAVGEPFVLYRDGSRQVLEHNGDTVSFTAWRKYPENHLGKGGASMKGAVFECANRADFRDARAFFRVEANTLMDVCRVACPEGRYRYWRIRPDSLCQVAELAFLADGKAVDGVGVNIPAVGHLCFDGDPLSYAVFSENAVFDFGEPVHLDTIRYLPLNDGNGIYPGDYYDLRRWTPRGWISISRKRATGYSLAFEDIPSGGLYLLKNVYRGDDERPFAIEGGEAVFY